MRKVLVSLTIGILLATSVSCCAGTLTLPKNIDEAIIAFDNAKVFTDLYVRGIFDSHSDRKDYKMPNWF